MPNNPIPSEHFHDGALISCKLTDWTFTRYHTSGKSEYAVVYGTVAQDGSGRFAAGSRIRTSPVTRWAAPLAHTHNSVYFLPEGAGCFRGRLKQGWGDKKQPALFCPPICRSIPTVGRRLPSR